MNDQVRAGWASDEVATDYDRRRFGSWVGRASHLLDAIALARTCRSAEPRSVALDLPCGTGRLTSLLPRLGSTKIVAADISEQMLTMARQRLGTEVAEFVVCDATATPFADRSFDLVISVRFTGHIDDQTFKAVLTEFRRVCRGTLVVENTRPSVVARTLKSGILRRLSVRSRLPVKFDWHDRTTAELKALAAETGWTVEKVVSKLALVSESVYVVFR